MNKSSFDPEVFNELESTNDYLRSKISQGFHFEEGKVVMAHFQRKGRGLGENVWNSNRGENLTFSMYLQPVFLKPENQFVLNMAISLALLKYVDEIVGSEFSRIKWPNDIYVNDKKIAGVLIQHSIVGNKIENTIVGVGLNVNQVDFPEILPNPVSLKQLVNRAFNLMDELFKVSNNLFVEYQRLKHVDYLTMKREYTQALFWRHENRSFRFKGQSVHGKIEGVNDFGLLAVRTEEMGLIECNLKELEFLV